MKTQWTKGQLVFLLVLVLLSAGVEATRQKTAPACEGYRYEIEKKIPHPGMPASATLCVDFPVWSVIGDAYNRQHFEQALRDAGYAFTPPTFHSAKERE